MCINLDHDWTKVTTGCLRIFRNCCTDRYKNPVCWLYSSFTRLKFIPQQGENQCGDLLEGFPRAYISQSGSFPHTKQGGSERFPAAHVRTFNGSSMTKLPLATTVWRYRVGSSVGASYAWPSKLAVTAGEKHIAERSTVLQLDKWRGRARNHFRFHHGYSGPTSVTVARRAVSSARDKTVEAHFWRKTSFLGSRDPRSISTPLPYLASVTLVLLQHVELSAHAPISSLCSYALSLNILAGGLTFCGRRAVHIRFRAVTTNMPGPCAG